MLASLPPGIIMILGACAVPFIPHISRQIWMLAMIGLSAWGITNGDGIHAIWHVMGYDLILYRADALTMPFAIIFHLAAALNVIYSWHDWKWQEHTASLSYAGAAIAALHAGDLITLFIWWEATAITSVFLILASNTERARKASMRYLIFQVTSGVLLLCGAAILAANGQSILFEKMELGSLGGGGGQAGSSSSLLESRRPFRFLMAGYRMPIPKRRRQGLLRYRPLQPSWRFTPWHGHFRVQNI